MKTRVLVIDDSALIRSLLSDILASDPELEVVGTASDAIQGWNKIQALVPDVITLDVEMPKLDGLQFLEKLMRAHPMPVVMISSLTERGAITTLRALQLGAFDVVAKPKIDIATSTIVIADEIIAKVKAAAKSRPRRAAACVPPAADRVRPVAGAAVPSARVIAIGASTGGTQALEQLLGHLPADAPGVVVVQHMPAGFTRAFADRLDTCCSVRVSEACDGDAIRVGHVLIAPGDRHLRVASVGDRMIVRLGSGEAVNHHRPSVDVLFESCAAELGPRAVGAILTGMGADGARGLTAMRRAGARTIAQNEQTCVVFGMPKEAIALGGVDEILPLEAIAAAALRLAHSPVRR